MHKPFPDFRVNGFTVRWFRNPQLSAQVIDFKLNAMLGRFKLKSLRRCLDGFIEDFYWNLNCPFETNCPAGQKKWDPGFLKFENMADPSLHIITIYLICLIYAREMKRRFLKKYINFTLYPKSISHWIQESIFLTIYAVYLIWFRCDQ